MGDGEAGAAGVLRRVARRTVAALWWPVGMAVSVLYVVVMCSPRRVPDLARFTRSAEFTGLQSAAADWVDQQPALIEGGAPWLDREGGQVLDRCATILRTREFCIPRDPPGLDCTRLLTVVYGADGELDARLSELATVLGAAGWGNGSFSPYVMSRVPAFSSASWSPGHGAPLPAALESAPPLHMRPLNPQMRIAWVSRDQPAEDMTSSLGDPQPRTAATPVCRPVEVSGTSFVQLASQVLTRHEHAIALQINVCYYGDSNVNAQPGRLRKRLLPVWRFTSD